MNTNFGIIISDCVKKWIKKWGTLFSINMALCSFAYSLLMIHQLVNRMDGIWHGSISYAGNHERCIGRWLWPYYDKLRLLLSPDPITSILSLSFFILSVILILDIFGVEHRLWQYTISLMFTINVSVLVALSYRYMSPVFATSCFFSVLAAYLMIKYENKPMLFIAAPLCIIGMLGLYQAYLGCTCLILLVYFCLLLYKNDKNAEGLFRFLGNSVISLLIGGALYAVLTKLILWAYKLEISSYGGADKYGLVGFIQNFGDSFHDSYLHFLEYYESDSIMTNIFGMKIYIIIGVLIVFRLSYVIFRVFQINRLHGLLFSALILLIPVACNVVLLFAFDYTISIQMTIPTSMCLPVLLCLLSNVPLMDSMPVKVYKVLFAMGVGIMIYGNYGMILYDQQAMYMSMESTRELASEIITSLQMNNLYHPYMKYVILGSPSENPIFAENAYIKERTNSYAHIGGWSARNLGTSVSSWQGLFSNVMGINLYMADEEYYEIAWNDPFVQQMPVFPEKGSIVLMKDVVVVKVSNTSESNMGGE